MARGTRAARRAVTVIFLLDGVLMGSWAARIPAVKERLDLGEAERYARDLVEDRGMRFLSRGFLGIALLGLLIPAALGYLLDGTLKGALTGLLWGGFVRIFMLHHVTWSINSVCHFFGRRRFEIEDRSTNVFWLALPSFGESWHHNHHAFPRSAVHGMKWWEIDTTAAVIRTLRRLRLAWNVVEISPERQAQKQAPKRSAVAAQAASSLE